MPVGRGTPTADAAVAIQSARAGGLLLRWPLRVPSCDTQRWDRFTTDELSGGPASAEGIVVSKTPTHSVCGYDQTTDVDSDDRGYLDQFLENDGEWVSVPVEQ